MGKVTGRDEYGVQIFYDPDVISRQISMQSEEVTRIKEEMATLSPGMAYLYRQKLEKAIKSETERLAEAWFQDFYGRIKKVPTATRIRQKTRISNLWNNISRCMTSQSRTRINSG
jgi:hypothetical protein